MMGHNDKYITQIGGQIEKLNGGLQLEAENWPGGSRIKEEREGTWRHERPDFYLVCF